MALEGPYIGMKLLSLTHIRGPGSRIHQQMSYAMKTHCSLFTVITM